MEFDTDLNMDGVYDFGDTFKPAVDNSPIADSQINDLDLYLLPKDAANFDNPIALSVCPDCTVDHIFAEIPFDGEYEIWVHQFDAEIAGGQNYAIAWWYGLAPQIVLSGDYDGGGTIGPEDYDLWKSSFGSTSELAADGNDDGVVDAADYTIWRNGLEAAGRGSVTTIPEPSCYILAAIGFAFASHLRLNRLRAVSRVG